MLLHLGYHRIQADSALGISVSQVYRGESGRPNTSLEVYLGTLRDFLELGFAELFIWRWNSY